MATKLMKTVTTTKGIPSSRSQITELQREIWGRMLDVGIYSQKDLARHLGISPWTLGKTMRGRRANPRVLTKLARFLGRNPASLLRAA